MASTEYTQSGNGRFLAYIPSLWKNQPWLVRVGSARPPPFTLFTFTYKVAVYTPAERADILPLFHLYPYVYSVMATFWRHSIMMENLAQPGEGGEYTSSINHHEQRCGVRSS
jgi:hypothetical protein